MTITVRPKSATAGNVSTTPTHTPTRARSGHSSARGGGSKGDSRKPPYHLSAANHANPAGASKASLVAALTVTALIGVASASASSTRASRGDALATFEAGPSGGWAIRLHSGNTVGPGQESVPGGVRITAFVDGLHYCVHDWHLIAVTQIDGNAPGESRTLEEIAADITTFTVALVLDGVPLETVRTPVKRFLNPESLGLVDGFWSTTGRVMAPSELSVGTHTLHTETTDPAGNVTFPSTVSFVVDPAGVGACL